MAILKKTDTFKTVYPNKVFDYMSCKKPVFVTIDGITRDLIETSNCGLYAEPENLDEFKNIGVKDKIIKALIKRIEEIENSSEYLKFDNVPLDYKYPRAYHLFMLKY